MKAAYKEEKDRDEEKDEEAEHGMPGKKTELMNDEKLKNRLRELVEEAKTEGKRGKDVEAIQRILKVMGDEIENSESATEETKLSWREQAAKIRKELKMVHNTAIRTTTAKPDKTQGIQATPLKTKDELVFQEARWAQLTSSTAEELVSLHGLPQSACAVIDMLKGSS